MADRKHELRIARYGDTIEVGLPTGQTLYISPVSLARDFGQMLVDLVDSGEDRMDLLSSPGCTGAEGCAAPIHSHGCFADRGAARCDDPQGHS